MFALDYFHDLIVHQMDVKMTFQNGYLDDKNYMEKPQDYVLPENE